MICDGLAGPLMHVGNDEFGIRTDSDNRDALQVVLQM